MSKVVDITDKLSFDSNPCIKIKDKEFEINAEATTVLKIMGMFEEETEIKASLKAAELLFGEKGMEDIKTMKLPMKDLLVIINTAMELVMGKEDTRGEEQTHTTT